MASIPVIKKKKKNGICRLRLENELLKRNSRNMYPRKVKGISHSEISKKSTFERWSRYGF